MAFSSLLSPSMAGPAARGGAEVLDTNAQPEVHVGNLPGGTKAAVVVEALQNQAGFAHQVIECKVKHNALKRTTYAFACLENAEVMRRLIDASNAGLGIRIGGKKLFINQSNRSRNIRLSPAESLAVVNVKSFAIGAFLPGCGHFGRRWTSTSAGIAPNSTKCTVNFDNENLTVAFPVDGIQYMLEYSLHDLNSFVVVQRDYHHCDRSRPGSRDAPDVEANSLAVALCFDLAPCVLKSKSSAEADVLGDLLHFILDLREALGWQRTLDTFAAGGDTLSQYFHILLESGRETRHLWRFVESLREHYIDYEHKVAQGMTVGRLVTTITRREYDQLCTFHGGAFKELFQLEVLISKGLVYREMLSTEFFDLLHHSYALEALRLCEEKFAVLENPTEDLRSAIAEIARRQEDSALAPNDENQMWVYRLNITPLTTYAIGPELDTSNRVLRHFSQPGRCYTERFLRIHIVEEDQWRLHVGSADHPLTEVLDDVYKKLSEGISFCGRRYEFLAMSNSQLREHACWFFAPLPGLLHTQDIRNWMGDFSGITNVAKYAARMGQCFSSTSTSSLLTIQPQEYAMIPDIKVDKYNFSDGIGMISPEFAGEAVASLNIKTGPQPSAFQIRFAGCKGVVAVNPHMPAGVKLQIRPSMRKFESNHLQLEVCQAARRFPGHLNREIILLLDTLGVPERVFLDLQKKMLEDIDAILVSRRAALIEIAREHNLLETYAIPTTMYAMLESGFEPGADPFLQSMLLGYRQNCLLLLEDKAHVHVEKAALLMGVLDESGALEYGQAVVQSRQDDHVVPVVGTIAIAKNPCLHPGDVRILQAVRPPPGNLFLQGLVDCLVFPSRGPRPHPDECSGSDLDGDQYFVTWDPQLIPPRPHEPANYDAAQPLEKLDIKMDDICQFFIDYMKNDALGPICIAHLAFADVMPKKACDPICLELAKLQSLAVDYPKTGVPCKRNRLRHTPKSYPDFLKKRNKVTHESSQVLGELYRDIARKRPSMFGSGSRLTPEACIDRSLLIPGWKAYEATAQQVRKEYNQQLISVMKRYRIWREEEAVGGYMVKIASRHHRRQKLHDVQAQVRLETLRLRVHYYEQEFMGLPGAEQLKKASAWYHVTYASPPDDVHERLDKDNRKKHKRHLMSFAWIPYRELCAIKASSRSGHRQAPAARGN